MKVKDLFENLPDMARVADRDGRLITLHSINWDGKRLTATNGFQLAVVVPDTLPDLEPAIIHLDALKNQDLELSIEDGTVTVEDDWQCFTFQIKSIYPDIDQIIPPHRPPKWVELDARELFELPLVKGQYTPHIILAANKDGDTVDVVSLDDRDKRGAVKAKANGSFSVAIDSRRLLNLAKAVMLPIKSRNRNTYPIRLYPPVREYGPCYVEPLADHESFTSYGVIMPMVR